MREVDILFPGNFGLWRWLQVGHTAVAAAGSFADVPAWALDQGLVWAWDWVVAGNCCFFEPSLLPPSFSRADCAFDTKDFKPGHLPGSEGFCFFPFWLSLGWASGTSGWIPSVREAACLPY